MARWSKGKSGNPKGRPRKGAAIADLARHQIEKYKLIAKLGSIGAGQNDRDSVDVDQQLRAIQLLLSYGYGPPRAEMNGNDGAVVIQVIYAKRNQIGINSAALSTEASDPGGEAFQRGLLRAPLGQDTAGNGPLDPPGPAR